MLAELFIRDFAIIDELRIEFCPGFNVMTGETGAGKSIILDATALVLGDRADTTMIRSGCEQAYVEATFHLEPELRASLNQLLESEGLDGGMDDLLLLTRELRVNGRNIPRINGRAVNLALLREVGDRLVDIHGQGEHLSLLKPRSHLPMLDAYAGLEQERDSFAKLVKQVRAVSRELRQLRQDERALVQRQDLLKFQLEEIDAANLKAGEEVELRNERTRLANAEKLAQNSNEALALLSGDDDDTPSAIDRMGQAERSVAQLAKLDGELAPVLERLQGLSFQIGDLADELLKYQQTLDFDPERLGFVEERIDLINRLKRKFGDDITAILAWRDKAERELEGISHSEERLAELSIREDQLLHQIGDLGQVLSEKRQLSAKELSQAIEQELKELSIERARFGVAFSRKPDAEGAYVGQERLAFDLSGTDQVEFLVSANPGEALKPLAKVASGGETSRLMLALKSVLMRVDATPTLIFDEIDQGIGGRVGDVVGRKLWRLTEPAQHQVIVVTHLPQLAGYADGHYHVSKRLNEGRTTTAVSSLDKDGRIKELAAMLGTRGEHATGGAESILEQVATVKNNYQPS